MRKILAAIASIALALGGFVVASPAAAVDYTKSEQAAWKALKKNKLAKTGRKEVGKYRTIQMMYRVCEMMDEGDDWDDVSNWWMGIAMTAQNDKQARDFLGYGAGVSGSALLYLCPWNLVGTPFAR